MFAQHICKEPDPISGDSPSGRRRPAHPPLRGPGGGAASSAPPTRRKLVFLSDYS